MLWKSVQIKWIKIEASQNKKWYFLHFIDSGEGIDRAIADRMFQPFLRLRM